MDKVKIVKDVDKSIEVMYNVGSWMKQSDLNPSKWWKPENMNKEFMLKHAEPEEFYVAMMGDKPAVSMVLQETERNQSWKSVDGDRPKKALYVHWLCVHRDFAGQGFPKTMVDFAKNEARTRGFTLLRLDTIADEKKLCLIYESLGFKLVGTEDEDGHKTAFYEKKV